MNAYYLLLVYIYRVVSVSENGVSSTREICIGALNLQEGEIRQIQFVQDDTMMLLWSNDSMYRPRTLISPTTNYPGMSRRKCLSAEYPVSAGIHVR
jgi:hypothetical protein